MNVQPCPASAYPAAPFPRLRVPLPLFETYVQAGFPSPAEGYQQRPIDLNELLVTNPPATFILRVEGESMRTDDPGEQNIGPGDLLIVNRALAAKNGHIVVACLDGEFTVKKLRRQGRRVWLEPANRQFARIEVGEERDFQVWGVVTSKVTQFKV